LHDGAADIVAIARIAAFHCIDTGTGTGTVAAARRIVLCIGAAFGTRAENGSAPRLGRTAGL